MKIKAVNLRFSCRMNKYERVVFMAVAECGDLGKYPVAGEADAWRERLNGKRKG